MPDPTTPLLGDAGTFVYEINESGNLLIDGESAGKVQDTVPEQETQAPVEDKTEEEPKAEAAAPEEPTKPVPEPVAESVLPDKVKLKVKVYGEESEREFTREELVVQVQKGLAAEKRFQEVAEKERQMDPFLHIKDSPEFKEWLSQIVIDKPELAPTAPPPPSPEDVMGYRLRREMPESGEILEAMRDWALTLPTYEAKQLESNHKVFNMAFDRFVAVKQVKKVDAPPVEKPPVTVIPDKEAAEKVIAAKEKQKESARTVPPSVAAGERDAVQVHKKQEAELRKRIRGGDRNAEFALAALLYAGDLDRQR